MDIAQTWAEALNISPENLNEWSTQVPEGKPMLVWCIEQGHVTVSDYLMWATERFGLPVLSSSFFSPEGLSPEFLTEQRASGAWTAWNYPVEQWDGVVFVACVEPPEEVADGVRYVLADPRAMLEAWELSGGATGDAAAEPEKEPDAPAGITMETKTFTLNFDAASIMGPNKGGHAAPAAPAPKKPAPREETVVGDIGSEKTELKSVLKLDDSFTKTNMNASIHLSRPAENAKTPPPPAEAKTPGLPPTPAAAAAAKAAATAKADAPTVKLNIPSTPAPAAPAAKPAAAPAAPAASAKPAAPPAPAAAPAAPKPIAVKPVAVASVVEEAIAEESTDVEDGTVIDAPDLSAKTLLTRFASPTERLNLPPNESMALQKAFAHINKVFKGSCLLRLKDGVARFYKSDGTLPGDASTVHLNLDEPSFLRIVMKTGLPYHGYIVDSPVHRQFFKALTGDEMPKCVTAVPLKVGNKIWGVLLAIGTDELQTLESLGLIEGTAVQLLTALQSTWAKAA